MKRYKHNYINSLGLTSADVILCEVCGTVAVDVHHVTPRSLGGTDEPSNLIALCRSDHSDAHSGELERGYLQGVVERRIECYERVGNKFKSVKEIINGG